MASSVNCRRCRLPFQEADERAAEQQVCLACALSTARVPLGQHFECRWHRDACGYLQQKWTGLGARTAGARARDSDDAAIGEPTARFTAAEICLKVIVHAAGFAALAAAPAVANMLARCSDQLKLLP